MRIHTTENVPMQVTTPSYRNTIHFGRFALIDMNIYMTKEEAEDAASELRKAMLEEADQNEQLKILVMHAVFGMLAGCGNSYANAYTEKWLKKAKELGCYEGNVVGKINDLMEAWSYAEEHLPDIPDLKEAE